MKCATHSYCTFCSSQMHTDISESRDLLDGVVNVQSFEELLNWLQSGRAFYNLPPAANHFSFSIWLPTLVIIWDDEDDDGDHTSFHLMTALSCCSFDVHLPDEECYHIFPYDYWLLLFFGEEFIQIVQFLIGFFNFFFFLSCNHLQAF